MRWTAPLDRREIALIFFSLTVFLLSYNLDATLELVGVDPRATIFNSITHGKTKLLGKDGRKPPAWRDVLEREIFGDWAWDENHVAGDGAERSQTKGSGQHGATWISKEEAGPVSGGRLGNVTVDHEVVWWMEDFPETKILKHVPGYTILDNVLTVDKEVYIVTNDPESVPPMHQIISTKGAGFQDWLIISPEEAFNTFGGYGSIIHGVSWMTSEHQHHNATLFALWRTYASLDPSIDASGRTTLAPPQRLFFPQRRFFSDDNPPFEKYWLERARTDTGFHPYLMKAALPQLTSLYLEDWEDYEWMRTPWIIERLVVQDRQAAAENAITADQPAWTHPFTLEGSTSWWEPVRLNLARYFQVKDHEKKPVVTYLHSQGEEGEDKLPDLEHEALTAALKKMGKDYGYEVYVVSSSTLETDWSEKMEAVVRSTIVLGVNGNHLWDAVFMKPSHHSTLMEFFPTDAFARDREFAVRSIGHRYIPWWNSRKFTDELPPVSSKKGEVHIDASAVVRTIREILSS